MDNPPVQPIGKRIYYKSNGRRNRHDGLHQFPATDQEDPGRAGGKGRGRPGRHAAQNHHPLVGRVRPVAQRADHPGQGRADPDHPASGLRPPCQRELDNRRVGLRGAAGYRLFRRDQDEDRRHRHRRRHHRYRGRHHQLPARGIHHQPRVPDPEGHVPQGGAGQLRGHYRPALHHQGAGRDQADAAGHRHR